MTGALLIDKPSGPTSHDIVAFVRRTLHVDRAGHTGTLDPLATGLLIVLVGSATRLAQFLATDEKEYVAEIRLGLATRTYDRASLDEALSELGGRRSEVGRFEVQKTAEEIEEALRKFRCTFLQTPPPYSAKKIASVPAYEKARKNQPVDLKPVEVTVAALERIQAAPSAASPASAAAAASAPHLAPGTPDPTLASLLRLRIAATAGFYVRSLAHDIGEALGCGAHLESLRRTRVGRFRVEDALTLDRVESEGAAKLTLPSDLLGHMPAVTVTEDGSRRVAHGNPLSPRHTEKASSSVFSAVNGAVSSLRVLGASGELLAVAEVRPGGILQPVVVLR